MKRRPNRRRRAFAIESCEPRLLLTVGIFADVERSNFGSSPSNFTELSGKVLFTAHDQQRNNDGTGFQVYATDGTEQGTELLRRFDRQFFGERFIPHGEQLYFTATLGHGNNQQLWRTDGSPSGTVQVSQLAEGIQRAASGFVSFADHIYFAYADGPRAGLWRSDGTDSGTTRVTTAVVGFESPTVAGNSLYFAAADAVHGRELWKTDGTAEGTQLVKDIRSGDEWSSFDHLTALGDSLYFFTDDGVHGHELWVSDGTEAGTALVKDLVPVVENNRPVGLNVEWMLDVEGLLYFSASGPGLGKELWRSDGTLGGTSLLKDINAGPFGSSPHPYAIVDGNLLFQVRELNNMLWISDGTPDGTRAFDRAETGFPWSPGDVETLDVRRLYRQDGSTGGVFYYPEDGAIIVDDGTSSAPRTAVASSTTFSLASGGFLPLDSIALFSADDGINGPELWRTDGSPAGTMMVSNVFDTGSFASSLRFQTKIGDLVYFLAQAQIPGQRSVGDEIWVSDGTPAGTRLLKDINPTGSQALVDPSFTKVGDDVLFVALTQETGLELWKTDGTTAGTVMVRDILEGPETAFVEVRSLRNLELFTVFNDEAYFIATDGRGNEIWKSDGAGTQRVTRIRRDGESPRFTDLTVFKDAIYFGADDGVNGLELWRTKGDIASTEIVATIQSGPRGGEIFDLTVLGDQLFFTADGSETGRELWVTDGTGDGTRLVRDIRPNNGSSAPSELTVVGNLLAFTAETQTRGRELWVSDGTAAGTRLAVDLFSGPDSSSPRALAAVGNQLYFTAFEPQWGRELWATDLTPSGTRLVKDFNAFQDTQIDELHVVGDKFAFLLPVEHQPFWTVWTSDGTAERTSQIQHLTVPDGDALRVYDEIIYLVADDGLRGRELWFVDPFNPSLPQVIETQIGPTPAGELPSLSLRFSHDVSASLDVNDLVITDDVSQSRLGFSAALNWNDAALTATWLFDQLPLPPGHYSIRLGGSDVQDTAGNLLDGNHDFLDGDDHVYRFSVFLEGDANRNGTVDFDDFLELSENFGQEVEGWHEADFDDNGRVDFADFLALSLNFGKSIPARNAVDLVFAKAVDTGH